MVRLLGLVIAACGAALCYGAAQLWPAGLSSAADVLRILGAAIAGILGVANVAAGLVIVSQKTARE
ncbi:MAG: hypothetical protein IT518_07455 [Burkholderiales bacterium]|nr:hypothetical protein [Burkholderiales bacterium]